MLFSDALLNLPVLQPLTIDRERLLDKLRRVVEHKLTLIIAPPGYGKTTLALQFAQRTAHPVAWHSVEKTERDVASFFEHARFALTPIAPEVADLQLPAGATAGELALALTTSVRDTKHGDFVYVMDDVQHTMDSAGTQTFLQVLISNLPSPCHLVLIGRALPAIPVIEMVARRQILSMGQAELSFTLQEVQQLAEKAGFSLTPPQIQKTFSRVAGWPTGILLSLQPLPADVEAILFQDRAGPEALFDAFAEVMFQNQPPPLQEFLLYSSTLTRITPALCEHILQIEDSAAFLTACLNRSLFMTQIPRGVVYHTLFRDFLQRQLRRRDPARFFALHAAAGAWFEAENQFEEAFEHYLAAEQWEQAIALAERTAQVYLASGKTETLLDWKWQLDRWQRKTPRLLYWCAMIHRDRYEYEEALAAAGGAEAGYRAQGNHLGLIQTALLKATIENQRGNHRRAIALADPYIHLPSVPPNLRGFALAIRGTAELYLGDFETALATLDAALPLWRDTGDAFAVAQLLMTLEVTYLRLGRFQEAARCVQEVVSIRRAFGGTVGMVMALNNLGYHQHLLGEYPTALQTLQEALDVANRVAEHRAESHLLWTLGDLQRDRGAFGDAEHHYRQALRRIDDHEPFLQVSVLASLATQKRWQGLFEAAFQLALEAEALAEKHHLIWEQQLAAVARCAVQAAQGDSHVANPGLQKGVDQWCKYPAPQLAHTLGVCASAALARSDEVAAQGYLQRALKTVGHPALLQPLIAEIVHSPALKAFVLRTASRYEVLRHGIERLEHEQVQASLQKPGKTAQAASTYSLRIWTFGQESIERDGKTVPLSVWQAAGARELFFYLLFRGPASREQIGLCFWPDSTVRQVRQNFHTTLHRIRDAVGTNTIVFEQERYAVNPDIDLWCDVLAFETTIQQARLSSPLVAHTETLWRRAVELYRGDFLAAFDSEWVTNYREALIQDYLEALLALSSCLYRRDAVTEAIVFLKQALAVDPYREEMHRLLIHCYGQLGQRSLILQHMETLTQLFETELGMSPSLETLTLSQTLLN